MITVLKKTKLFQGIDDGELEKICTITQPSEKTYSRNQIILNQGEPVNKIGILKKGSVIGEKYHYNGNKQILRIFHEGEVILLDAVNTSLSTSPVTFISQAECSVIFLSYCKLFEAESISSKTKESIMANSSEILSNELIRLMYKIDVLSKRTLRERILTYLSLIRERTGGDSVDLGMNQEQFAQYLCVNRSVLSNELNRMRKEGVIDYKGNHFTVF